MQPALFSGGAMEKEKYLLFLGALAVLSIAAVPLLRDLAQGQDSAGGNADLEKAAASARAILSEVDGADPGKVWDAGSRIESLGEGAVPFLKTGTGGLPEAQQIAAAWALSKLGQRPFALDRALAMLSGPASAGTKVMAAELAGRIGDASAGRRIQALLDETFDPRLKIALAKALWDTSREVRAKDDLRNLLKSSDETVRIPAAFALAEIGDIEPVKDILAGLKDEPTDRGRLAAVLLRQHAMLKRLERWTAEGGEHRRKFDDAILDEMRLVINTYYVDQHKGSYERLSAESARGVAAALDPYCAYAGEKDLLTLQDRISGRLVGVGLVVGRKGFIPVAASVMHESPAAEAGFRPLDEIWEIDGQKIIEDGLSLLEIENLLHRLPGKTVKIKVYRRGWFTPKEVTVACRAPEPARVLAAVLPGGILYAKPTGIASGVPESLAAEIAKAGDLKGVILDLRNNPGGSLADTVALLGLFLPKGSALFRTEGRDKAIAAAEEYASGSESAVKAPAAVLIDKGTFGTAELAAAVLKSRGRAQAVGEATFGKGSVQQILMLASTGRRTGVMLTVARYYVGGAVFDGTGVAPDVQVDVPQPEIWKPELVDEILEKKHDARYIESHMAAEGGLLRKLAAFDERNWSLYPGFEEWHKSLNTHLDMDDTRALLRRSLRKHIGRLDGKQMIADLVEDSVLQKAVASVASRAGIDLSSAAEYKFVK